MHPRLTHWFANSTRTTIFKELYEGEKMRKTFTKEP